jgi:hypothetical protein
VGDRNYALRDIATAALTEIDDDHAAVEVFVGVLGPPTPIAIEGQLESGLLRLALSSLFLLAFSNLLDNERR